MSKTVVSQFIDNENVKLKLKQQYKESFRAMSFYI